MAGMIRKTAPNVNAGEGVDSIQGGSDNDFVLGDEGNDLIYLGEGDDLAWVTEADFADDSEFGQLGNDTNFGDTGNDEVYDYSGRNQIFGGAGNDLVIGNYGDILSGGADIIRTIVKMTDNKETRIERYNAADDTLQLFVDPSIANATAWKLASTTNAQTGDVSLFLKNIATPSTVIDLALLKAPTGFQISQVDLQFLA